MGDEITNLTEETTISIARLRIPIHWVLTVIVTISISFGGVYTKMQALEEGLRDIHTSLLEQNRRYETYEQSLSKLRYDLKENEVAVYELRKDFAYGKQSPAYGHSR